MQTFKGLLQLIKKYSVYCKEIKSYSVWDAITTTEVEELRGISTLWVMFLLSAFLFPLMVTILCGILWTLPTKRKWQRRIYYFAEVRK